MKRYLEAVRDYLSALDAEDWHLYTGLVLMLAGLGYYSVPVGMVAVGCVLTWIGCGLPGVNVGGK